MIRTAPSLAACLVGFTAVLASACSVRGEPERAALGNQPMGAADDELVGTPLSDDERREAYTLVLRNLPDRIRQSNPALRPVVCLDRGIRTQVDGAYVEEHSQKWTEEMQDDGLAAAVGDRSTAGCPDQSFWVTLLVARLLPGDSVAVPLTVRPVLRGTGGQVDARSWMAVLTGRNDRWVVAGWR